MCASSIGFVPDPTGSLPGLGSNSEITAANPGGDTVIARSSANTAAIVTFSGSASTRNLALSTSGAESGDRMTVKSVFPSTPGIVVNFRNATVGGTVLDNYSTDGSILAGTWEFYFDGVAWNYLRAQVPS